MLYPSSIVMVPVYTPLQSGAATRQCAVTVTASGEGPHVASPGGPIVRLILDGLLTVAWNTTSVSFGAHLTNSATLPVPALPEKVMVTGFADHNAFGALRLANPTAKYAPTMMRLMVRPTSKCGRYRLVGFDKCKAWLRRLTI